MPADHFANITWRVVLTGWAIGTASIAYGAEFPSVKPTRTPLARMSLDRLRATHQDVERLAKQRRTLPPVAGLTDFRAILHAHAEDSSHTGGTRPEMLTDAVRAGVHVIWLSDHHRPPRDFMTDSWRGIREGVLFIPGSEARGFLLYPAHTIMPHMAASTDDLIAAARRDRGLIFLSHIEERPDHPMTGLDGMEIYNRHADAKKDIAGILGLVMKMTAPESLAELTEAVRAYPDELLASQVEYPADYLAKWDAETKKHRLTGVAANDCHHNNILIMKMVDAGRVKIGTNVDADDKYKTFSAALRPGIRQLTKDRMPGDVLARLDLDPYYRSFRNVSTHILAPELTEPAMRTSLSQGNAYVSHDWLCDPTGFTWRLVEEGEPDAIRPRKSTVVALMGDELTWRPGLKLVGKFPISCRMRLLESGRVIRDETGEQLWQDVSEPGVYRIEGWLRVDDEDRPWIYSNPIYIRASGNNG